MSIGLGRPLNSFHAPCHFAGSFLASRLFARPVDNMGGADGDWRFGYLVDVPNGNEKNTECIDVNQKSRLEGCYSNRHNTCLMALEWQVRRKNGKKRIGFGGFLQPDGWLDTV